MFTSLIAGALDTTDCKISDIPNSLLYNEETVVVELFPQAKQVLVSDYLILFLVMCVYCECIGCVLQKNFSPGLISIIIMVTA